MNLLLVLLTMAVTLGAYIFSRFIYKLYPNPLLNVVFLSTALIIAVFWLSGVTVSQYQEARNILTYLLGPATVALALPLYRNREILGRNILPVLGGIAVGTTANIVTTVWVAEFLGLDKLIVTSLVPKSVTVPIAVSVSGILNGDPTLTSVFVIVTGMIGTFLTPLLLNLFKVHNPLVRGLAYGTTAHGQGTASALAEGTVQGSMSGVAMGIAAIYMSIAAPFLVYHVLSL
ncbi:putative effector of murein hydrolase [Desulfosporosinus orientis DSM 765]|uniref:Putative effector of murein hydrolase n=1 Tax=Desulfosporosinus orientis (strain ATCC 19365 / DSM 765 / NCIMB 8382 / VKM B-1628 / Singapore I) TaxID=768706 RepID=G7WBU3_DESOD|nr:LrgB family protein [Desulfosporosinus orientis]AET69340.1 putative effector of murein hydrolase [Desulfosporosinus orientis DSM 765]